MKPEHNLLISDVVYALCGAVCTGRIINIKRKIYTIYCTVEIVAKSVVTNFRF
jgi:hypothetical protein